MFIHTMNLACLVLLFAPQSIRAASDPHIQNRGIHEETDSQTDADTPGHLANLEKLTPSGAPGFFYDKILAPEAFQAELNPLVEVLKEKFAHGTPIVTVIYGLPNHYQVLAFQIDGKITLINFLSAGHPTSPHFEERGKLELLAILHEAHLKNQNGEWIEFMPILEIFTEKRKEERDSLVLARLNASQIAQRGSMDAFSKNSTPLSSASLNDQDLAQTASIHSHIHGRERRKSIEGFLTRNERKISLVSAQNCTQGGDQLTDCHLDPIHLLEQRSLPHLIPYETAVHIERTPSCRTASVVGNILFEITSEKGISNQEINYSKSTRETISLPLYAAIEKLVIEAKNSKIYHSNRYPSNCEITLIIQLNTPTAKSKGDALAIREKLDFELRRSQEQLDILTSIEAFREGKQQSEGILAGWISKLSSDSKKSPLLRFNQKQFDIFIEDDSGKYDDEAKDLFASVAEVISRAKLQATQAQPLDLIQILSPEQTNRLNQATQRLSQLVTSDQVKIAKQELLHNTAEYEHAVASLTKYFDGDSEKQLLENELEALMNNEINGEEGLVVRIASELYPRR